MGRVSRLTVIALARRRNYPAYVYMRDADGDGVVREG